MVSSEIESATFGFVPVSLRMPVSSLFPRALRCHRLDRAKCSKNSNILTEVTVVKAIRDVNLASIANGVERAHFANTAGKEQTYRLLDVAP
jgi:hypothetical protein